MHFAGLFHLATDTTTGAVLVLSLPCALILFAVWLAEQRLRRRQMQRELEAERQRIADEALKAATDANTRELFNTRKVFNAVNRFRGRP